MDILQRIQASPIKMGMTVENSITGFRGVVTSFTLSVSGSFQAGVTPKARDNEEKDAINMDIFNLNQIIETPIHPSIEPDPADLLKVKPNDKTRSTLNGLTGKVEWVTVFINGCVHAGVIPEFNPKATRHYENIPVSVLEVLEKGASTPTGKKPTGGPSIPLK